MLKLLYCMLKENVTNNITNQQTPLNIDDNNKTQLDINIKDKEIQLDNKKQSDILLDEMKSPKENKPIIIIFNSIVSIVLLIIVILMFVKDPESSLQETAFFTIRYVTSEAVKGIFDMLPENNIKKIIIIIIFSILLTISIIYIIMYSKEAMKIIGESAVRSITYTITSLSVIYIIKLFNQQ